MPRRRLKLRTAALLLLLSQVSYADERQTLFNDAWRFYRGDVAHAMQADFSDEYWRMVDLPHDWRMEPDSLDVIDELADTVGWYRKTFTIRDEEADKRVFLYFERIHGRTEVWVNGHSVYRTPCSYQPIRVDVICSMGEQYGGRTCQCCALDRYRLSRGRHHSRHLVDKDWPHLS